MVRVLAVDDDPTILRLLEVNLEMDGHEVFTASNGAEALRRVEEVGPDAVLLDVMMPELDGWQVCQRLRADARFADLPVIFLSARAQTTDLTRGDEVGADAYVTKPFDPMALMELIERVVAERG